jgi:hypothetical protein
MNEHDMRWSLILPAFLHDMTNIVCVRLVCKHWYTQRWWTSIRTALNFGYNYSKAAPFLSQARELHILCRVHFNTSINLAHFAPHVQRLTLRTRIDSLHLLRFLNFNLLDLTKCVFVDIDPDLGTVDWPPNVKQIHCREYFSIPSKPLLKLRELRIGAFGAAAKHARLFPKLKKLIYEERVCRWDYSSVLLPTQEFPFHCVYLNLESQEIPLDFAVYTGLIAA